MNKKLLSVLFLACALSTAAQKIDLDKKNFIVEYLTLPTDATLSYFDKYSTDFFADQTVAKLLGLKPATINSFFQLDGYQYTQDIAEFNYSIQIEKPQTLQDKIVEKTDTYKNPDGTSKTVITYIATSVALIPTTLSLKLIPYGTSLYTSQFAGNSDPIVYQSAPQLTRESAQLLLMIKVGGINSEIKNIYLQLLQTEIKKLKNTCCFAKDSSKVFLMTVNEKEKDTTEYGRFNKSVSESVAILENLKYNEPIDDIRKKMNETLTYWSENATAISSSEKHLKKLKFAYLWNLAISQFYLEYLDECERTCQLLIENDHNKNDAIDLLNAVQLVRDSFQKSGLKSRHINRVGFTSEEHYEYAPNGIPVQKKNNQNK